jgi:aminopeptidase-like protein
MECSSDRQIGFAMHELARELYPVCRSITGDGVRQTLGILRRFIELKIREVPSGTAVFDWNVPREWNIRAAYIVDPSGRKIVDFAECNLHVMSYSTPVRLRLPLAELKKHLFTLPEHPEWIPYRTSYYNDNWGFCLSHRQLLGLPEGDYEVYIDSSFKDGALTYGEYVLPGETEDEVVFSTHVCHPSLANDNLSAITVAVFLARWLRTQQRRYSYRFLFTPGAIGSIVWLALNEGQLARIRAGLVLACLGDSGQFTYKKSRRGDTEIDRVVVQALKDRSAGHEIIDFFPFGYDERQFCSPGINLPMGALMRTPHGQFAEYHTSADNLEFIKPANLDGSLELCRNIVELLEGNRTFLNLNPKCEPQLGRRGLYGSIGGQNGKGRELALLWVLNFSDGSHSLIDIAERSGMSFAQIADAAGALMDHGLLAPRL